MFLRKTSACLFSAFVFTAASTSASVFTDVQTINFDPASNGTFVSIDDSFIGVEASSAFSGFQKFDASLGTLQQVILTAQVSVTVEYFF